MTIWASCPVPARLVDVLMLDSEIVEAIVAHARLEHPDEACGMVAGLVGSDRPTRHIPMVNAVRSPIAFAFDSVEYLRAWREMDARGEEPLVIYHSHTGSEATPSPDDVAYAGWPQAHYLLVSTRMPQRTEIRSFRIVDGVVTEEPVLVEQGDVPMFLFGQNQTTVDYECCCSRD